MYIGNVNNTLMLWFALCNRGNNACSPVKCSIKFSEIMSHHLVDFAVLTNRLMGIFYNFLIGAGPPLLWSFQTVCQGLLLAGCIADVTRSQLLFSWTACLPFNANFEDELYDLFYPFWLLHTYSFCFLKLLYICL